MFLGWNRTHHQTLMRVSLSSTQITFSAWPTVILSRYFTSSLLNVLSFSKHWVMELKLTASWQQWSMSICCLTGCSMSFSSAKLSSQPTLGWHISRLGRNKSSLKHRTGSPWVKLVDCIFGFSCFGLLKVSSLVFFGLSSLCLGLLKASHTHFFILMPVFHPLSLLSSLQWHTSEPQHDYTLLHS